MTVITAQSDLPDQTQLQSDGDVATNTPSCTNPSHISHAGTRRMLAAVAKRICRRDSDYPFLKDSRFSACNSPVDYLFATAADQHAPDAIFSKLRWGGQLVFVSDQVQHAACAYEQFNNQGGFVIDHNIATARTSRFGLTLPLIGKKVFYFVARKVDLIPPGQSTERFTFNVQLEKDHVPHGDRRGYTVVKRIPTVANIIARLREKHTDVDPEVLERRATKLVEKIFPVFLTRETAFLKLLQRDLPSEYRHRVPRLLHMEQNSDGMVNKLVMNWLRIGGQPLDQYDFARQSAELLHAVHTCAKIIHLDVRLDNIVITPQGVSFVDFGSAVRVDEDISKSPLLGSLFDEMMSTSQIQRLLGRMKSSGSLTNSYIRNAHHKVDKAVDLFYLAMQWNKPHSNPDLAPFIHFDETSETARQIQKLTNAVMKPKDPDNPTYTSSESLLRGLDIVERKLKEKDIR
jgi:hypothetical protein